LMFKQYFMAKDCPQCGEKDEEGAWKGARMGSTQWGHNFPCCSDECGYAFAKNPKRLEIEIQNNNFRIKAILQENEYLEKERKKLLAAQT